MEPPISRVKIKGIQTKAPEISQNYLSLEQLQEYDNNLKKILLSSNSLQPIHVEVNNVSCWYYMRKKLKAKRHNAIILKPNATNSNISEGYIYDLKRREEDLAIAPKKTLIHSHEDRLQVWKQCEHAMRERDAQRIIFEETSLYERKPISLMSHIKLVVVSEKFLRLSSLERMKLIYEELRDSPLGRHVDPALSLRDGSVDRRDSQLLYRCPPSQMKGFSHFGRHVCELPLFQFLSHHPTNGISTVFIISALTPSQWRPNEYQPTMSERLGATHLGAAVLQVDVAAKPKSQKDRIRKLTTIPNQIIDPFTGLPVAASSTHRTAAQQIQAEEQAKKERERDPQTSPERKSKKKKPSGKEMADSLGLEPAVSGVKYQKLGGIYGHFFQDLSSEVKDLVMLKYENNRELIRDESRFPGEPSASLHSESLDFPKVVPEQLSFQPKTNAHRFRAKAAKDSKVFDGVADRGTKNPVQMREEVFLSNRKVELSAIRMQRIRRVHMYQRLLKWQWKQWHAAMTIQRVLRGHFGRRYFFLYQKLRPIAARKIQILYRAVVAHRIVTRWQRLVYRMTRVVLPKIKRFIRNCFLSWISRRDISARKIQALVRKYLARIKFYQQYGLMHFFLQIFESSAVTIQKHMRGYLGRKRFQIYLDRYLQVFIDVPAAIRLQRIFRGRLAKKYLEFLRYEKKCLLLLQKVLRRFVHRKWEAEVRYHRRLKQAATTIQRYYRGAYDRKLYRLKYFFFYYFHVYLPSAVKVQSYIRRFNAQLRVLEIRRRWRASQRIQRAYRGYKNYLLQKEFRRRLLEAKRVRYVVCLQKYVRRFLAYKKYQRWVTVQRGKEKLAAKIILRAWKTSKIHEKYAVLLEDFRIQEEEKVLTKYTQLKANIAQDLKEIQTDIQFTEKARDRLRQRLKLLDEFLVQAAFRLNKIQDEMNHLVMEDFEKGWAEAFGQEYEYILHQQLMAREELRLVRHKTYLAEEELFQLYVEYEENELELDSLDQLMIQTMEKSRLRQIARAETKANRSVGKGIYREKVHWKVTSNRSKKVLRLRSRYQEIVAETKKGRSIGYYTTVNFEKRQRRRDYETMIQEIALKNEAREVDERSRPKTYEEYATAFQSTFDKVIGNQLQTLRGMSLDERAKRIREQYASRMAKKRKAQKGQFSSLKEDFAGKLGV